MMINDEKEFYENHTQQEKKTRTREPSLHITSQIKIPKPKTIYSLVNSGNNYSDSVKNVHNHHKKDHEIHHQNVASYAEVS